MFALARRGSSSPTDAEDAAQEIFLALWQSADRFDAGIASETTYVAMIARRRLSDRRRAQRRRPVTEPIPDGSSPETSVLAVPAVGERAAEAALAARALEQLPAEQRDVLVLSAVHGLSHDEIAVSKGMALGTVKSHARRALMRVRAALLGEAPEESS